MQTHVAANDLGMTRKPTRESLGIPSEEAVRARLRAWVKHAVDKSSKTGVANSTGVSVAHISNIYNHAETSIGLDVFVGMVFGLDITARELLRDDPPAQVRTPAPPTAQTDAREARKRATKSHVG